MRLTPDQRRLIKEAVRDLFGPTARVSLFGSRVNDQARGGDIDLLIECAEPVENRVKLELKMTAILQQRLGDQRIDVLVTDPNTPTQEVHKVARSTGVPI